MIGTILDLLLAGTLLVLAWRVLHAPDLFESVVVFITLGLLMAVAWARLSAPDIALAEAAIGAGLTGVLLLDTLRSLHPVSAADPDEAPTPARRRASQGPALVCSGLLAAVLVAAVLALPRDPGGLTAEVSRELPRSGVSQPVTAVLLNFRAYDTWLELGVLLIAILGVLAMRGSARLDHAPPAPAGPMLAWLVRVLVPMVVLVAGYLLWLGKSAAGGAFQSGVVLGAAGVLLWLSGRRPVSRAALWPPLLTLGFTAFFVAAVGSMTAGRALLEFPADIAGTLILLIESAAAVSIGATLAALFIGLHFPPGRVSPSAPVR